MTAGFAVCYAESARADLLRLFDFLLERAQTHDEFEQAQQTPDTLQSSVEQHLSRTPFVYRKAGRSAFLRELIVPCRPVGYVVLYEIEDSAHVTVLAVRHQLEDDYH